MSATAQICPSPKFCRDLAEAVRLADRDGALAWVDRIHFLGEEGKYLKLVDSGKSSGLPRMRVISFDEDDHNLVAQALSCKRRYRKVAMNVLAIAINQSHLQPCHSGYAKTPHVQAGIAHYSKVLQGRVITDTPSQFFSRDFGCSKIFAEGFRDDQQGFTAVINERGEALDPKVWGMYFELCAEGKQYDVEKNPTRDFLLNELVYTSIATGEVNIWAESMLASTLKSPESRLKDFLLESLKRDPEGKRLRKQLYKQCPSSKEGHDKACVIC